MPTSMVAEGTADKLLPPWIMAVKRLKSHISVVDSVKNLTSSIENLSCSKICLRKSCKIRTLDLLGPRT